MADRYSLPHGFFTDGFTASDKALFSAVAANITELDTADGQSFEERTAHITELADIVYKHLSASDDTDLRELFYPLFREASVPTPTPVAENEVPLVKYFSALSMLEAVMFCKRLAYTDGLHGQKIFTPSRFFGAAVPPPPSSMGLIAYFRSSYSDTAYLKFATLLKKPRAMYMTSFTGICEELYNGRCEYGILPVHTSKDGKLKSFYSLIDKYEFKICAVTDITSSDGSLTTSLALVKKNIEYPEKRNTCIFEMSVVPDGAFPLDGLFTAASVCSLNLRAIDNLPLQYNSEAADYHCVFSFDPTDGERGASTLLPFLIFAEIFFPQYNPIGIYNKI